MSDRHRYSLEDDLDEAEEASRDLPGQIARVKAHVDAARTALGANDDQDVGEQSPS